MGGTKLLKQKYYLVADPAFSVVLARFDLGVLVVRDEGGEVAVDERVAELPVDNKEGGEGVTVVLPSRGPR